MNSILNIILLLFVGELYSGEGFVILPLPYEFALKGDDVIENLSNNIPQSNTIENKTISAITASVPTTTTKTLKPEYTTENIEYINTFKPVYVPEVSFPPHSILYENQNIPPFEDLDDFRVFPVDNIPPENHFTLGIPVEDIPQENNFVPGVPYYPNAEQPILGSILEPMYEPHFTKELIINPVQRCPEDILQKQTNSILERITQIVHHYSLPNKTNISDIRTDQVVPPATVENEQNLPLASNSTDTATIVDNFFTPDGDPCIKEIINLDPRIFYRYTCENKSLEKTFTTTKKSDVLQFTKELSSKS